MSLVIALSCSANGAPARTSSLPSHKYARMQMSVISVKKWCTVDLQLLVPWSQADPLRSANVAAPLDGKTNELLVYDKNKRTG